MNSNTIKNALIFLISSSILYILNHIPLNYLWGTFNSYLHLISGVGFSVWLINPLSYSPFLLYWFFTHTLFFKIPSLTSLFYLSLNKYNKYIGSFFYLIIMIPSLIYFYSLYGLHTTMLYCCGWILGVCALYYSNTSAILFSSIWLSHAAGTILHDIYASKSSLFYNALAPIAFCERLLLWCLAVCLYYTLKYLFHSKAFNIIHKKFTNIVLLNKLIKKIK